MKSNSHLLVRVPLQLALAAVLTGPFLFAQRPAGTPASPPPPAESPTVLSPFQVDASSEKGYLATQTLSGTRLKTDLRDVGAALTIFTEQMLDDLGATNINDIVAFAPNTDAFVVSGADNGGNDFINIPTQYVTRGGTTTVVGQDLFSNNVPQDRYNSESLTFTRGPNAILFGLGNAAGAFVSSTKRAKNRTATTVELRTDDNESFRAMVDHNQVIKKDLLAVRYAGLYEKSFGFRIPSEKFQRRHFVTAQLTPIKKTSIRFNYEQGLLELPADRPWPSYDAVSPWLAAGSPMIATVGAPRPPGTVVYNVQGLISTEFSPAGSKIPVLTWRTLQATSPLADYGNGFPAFNPAKRSFINPALYPTFASSLAGSYRLTDFKSYSVFFEQQIAENLFIEGAVNRTVSDIFAVNAFVGVNDTIYVDVNRQLPDRTPNPNAGRLYTESRSTVIVTPEDSLGKRLMASYDLDLTRRSSSWLRYLGRHRAAVFAEESDRSRYSSNMQIQNITSLITTGVPALVSNGANTIIYRYYYDPAAGQVGNPKGQFGRYPLLYSDTPLPPADPSGITSAYVSNLGPGGTDLDIKTYAAALQSSFWGGRLMLTNGWRTDTQQAWYAVAADFEPLRERTLYPDPTRYDLRKFVPQSRRERSGRTFTRGAVFHALPWLGLTYNRSDNFQPNDSQRNIYGDLLPNPKGRGSDYGVKLALLNQRVFVDLTYYENATVDKIDTVWNTSAGNFGSTDIIWQAIADYTGDPKYLRFPYAYINAGDHWEDSATTKSTGWEFSATANLTPQWRFTVNGSKRSASITSDRGLNLQRYLAEHIPIWKANAEWMALTTVNNFTVAQRVDMVESTLRNFKALQSQPEDFMTARWTFNMIQTYSFASDSRLAGFSIGGSVNARGRIMTGFAESAGNVVDPNRPYYSPATEFFGAWLTYQRKLFNNRISWRLQLNVRNLFDAYTLYPLRTVDRRDGTGTGTTAVYRLNEPRAYTLTSSFKF